MTDGHDLDRAAVGGGVELEVHRATLFGASVVGISGVRCWRLGVYVVDVASATLVAPALLDVLVIDHPGSPGSATRRAGSSAEDTVRGMIGGG